VLTGRILRLNHEWTRTDTNSEEATDECLGVSRQSILVGGHSCSFVSIRGSSVCAHRASTGARCPSRASGMLPDGDGGRAQECE
jgi:hypothetical protein